MLVLLAFFGIIMVTITLVIAFPIIFALNQLTLIAKNDVAKNIMGGTLGIASLALAFLGYSLGQRRQYFGKKISRTYSRVAIIMFILIPLSVVDAFVSMSYILVSSSCFRSNYSWLFELALFLIFAIGVVLIITTTYVVAEEFWF